MIADKTIEQICAENKGLIISMSNKYHNRFPKSYSIKDIMQIAWEHMIIAIKKYDPSMNVKMGTFLAMCIRNGFSKAQ